MKSHAVLAAVLCAVLVPVHAGPVRDAASASGVKGGVAVHIGCGDGEATVELYSGDSWLVVGLDTDAAAVERAKQRFAAKGSIYGAVSAEVYDGSSLPFGDNIVNLVMVSKQHDVSSGEIARVLAPGGMALATSPLDSVASPLEPRPTRVAAGWHAYRKSVSADIDEWTHFLYNSTNNAVSKDKRVGAPEHVQWFAGPEHTRDHDALASMSAMTSSNGRVFYIYDEGPISVIHQPADWKLIARDAFNGKLLWKRSITDWMTHLYNFRGGPVQLTRRLVSLGDEVFVTLGFKAAVRKLDAATGNTLMTYQGSDQAEELLVLDGTLLVATGNPDMLTEKADGCVGYWELAELEEATVAKRIIAYNAASGEQKWHLDAEELKGLVPLSLCAQADRAFYMDSTKLHCVNVESGKELWATDFKTEGIFIRAYAPTVVVHGDVIICLYYNRMQAFAVSDGRPLWEHDKGAVGFGSPGDLFIRDGAAWLLPMYKGVQQKRDSFPPKNVMALDMHTGAVRKSLPFVTNQHHHRCYRNKATANGIIIGYSGIQVFDWEKGTVDLNQWVRGLCQYGFMPANGYIYVPPDPCRCYGDVKINGFFALSETNSLDELEVEPVLQKGEAYGELISDQPAAPKPGGGGSSASNGDWPTYRGNTARNGGTNTALAEKLEILWEAQIGATVTASTAVNGKVYVAQRDAYTVYCLDASTGKELWRFMANGPVDTPPTITDGLCVFGCGDGSVYCLKTDGGRLVWRFKVSGVERRIGAEDRLESPWRVNGAVLVVDGTVYFAAGRSSHLDGGIKLYGIDLRTGETEHVRKLTSKKDNKRGYLADILREERAKITMRSAAFDAELAPTGGKTSLKGMLDGSWFYRQASARGNAQLAATNSTGTYTAVNPYTGMKQRRKGKSTTNQEGSKWNQVGHLHQKYTRYLQKDWFPVGASIRGRGWSVDDDIQPRAMVVAADRLYLAGWRDEMAVELKTGRALPQASERHPLLRVYSTSDGSRRAEYTLESPPVWDSAGVANGKLFLSLQNGKLVCMGKATPDGHP